MNTHCYQLRISGLAEDEGRIKATTLQRVVDALLAMAVADARQTRKPQLFAVY